MEHRSTDDLDSEPAGAEPLPYLDPAEARLHAHIATARAEIITLRSDLESAARADGADMVELRETIVAFHRRQSELERSLEAIATALVRTATALNRLSEDVRDLAGPSPVTAVDDDAYDDEDVEEGGEEVVEVVDG